MGSNGCYLLHYYHYVFFVTLLDLYRLCLFGTGTLASLSACIFCFVRSKALSLRSSGRPLCTLRSASLQMRQSMAQPNSMSRHRSPWIIWMLLDATWMALIVTCCHWMLCFGSNPIFHNGRGLCDFPWPGWPVSADLEGLMRTSDFTKNVHTLQDIASTVWESSTQCAVCISVQTDTDCRPHLCSIDHKAFLKSRLLKLIHSFHLLLIIVEHRPDTCRSIGHFCLVLVICNILCIPWASELHALRALHALHVHATAAQQPHRGSKSRKLKKPLVCPLRGSWVGYSLVTLFHIND